MAGFNGYGGIPGSYNPGWTGGPSGPMQMQTVMPQQMGQQIPAQPIQGTMQTMQGISPASRAVANREEAVATQADFSGAPMVFPDLTNGMVYIKRWNMQAGAAEFIDYAPVPHPAPQQAISAQSQQSEDIQEVKIEIQKLWDELEKIKKPIKGKQGGKTDGADE